MGSYYGPPSLYGYRPNQSIRDLLLLSGEQQAESARRSGEIWSNAALQLGQIATKYGEQRHQENVLKKQDAALVNLTQTWDGKDKKGLYANLVKIGGPEYAEKHGPAIIAFREPESPDPKVELPNMRITLKNLLEQKDPAMQEVTYQALLKRHGKAIEELGFGNLPGGWTPELAPRIKTFVDVLDGEAGHPAKVPALEKLKVAGPDGLPMERTYTPEEMRAGVSTWVDPPKPVAPKAVQHVDLGDSIGILDDEGKVTRRIPKGIAPKAPEAPAELTLNPEGVVLTGYGVKQKQEARKQAMERGLPVFENAAVQAKASVLKGIVSDAKELGDLFAKPEVQAAIGPFAGRFTQLESAFVDLPPDVQRAVQLMTSLSDTELRKRSGAQINEAEMKRILKFTTDPNKPLGHNKTAIAGLLSAGARDYKALSGVDIGSGPAIGERGIVNGQLAEWDGKGWKAVK